MFLAYNLVGGHAGPVKLFDEPRARIIGVCKAITEAMNKLNNEGAFQRTVLIDDRYAIEFRLRAISGRGQAVDEVVGFLALLTA